MYKLLQDYGGKMLPEMTEEDFGFALEDRFYIKNILDKNTRLPVKFSYLRKRVCHKLYKVLSKLVKIFF